jgi:hypothetical protein
LILPEPNLGDLGCIEENEEVYDPASLQDVDDEENEMSIKNSELIDLIASSSVKLTEAQMREAEGLYQMIGEEEKSAQ